MSNIGVCRTAPATPGLLNITTYVSLWDNGRKGDLRTDKKSLSLGIVSILREYGNMLFFDNAVEKKK